MSSVTPTLRYWQRAGLSAAEAMRGLGVEPPRGETVTWAMVRIVAELHEQRLEAERVAAERAATDGQRARRWRLVEIDGAMQVEPGGEDDRGPARPCAANPFERRAGA